MKLIIKDVTYKNINRQDNLYFTVENSLEEIFNSTPEYENFIVFNEGTSQEATLWVKIWNCGLARFGYTMKSDPLHGNREYTWSSNEECINKEFDLYDTKYELAAYGCCIKENTDRGCYFVCGLTKTLALEIAQDNEDKLHYGFATYIDTIDSKD